MSFRWLWGWSLALAVAGCAQEASETVNAELAALDADVGAGIDKIESALADPSLRFSELGDGVRQVENAVRGLRDVAGDAHVTDRQRLRALVLEARAWDDVALAFSDVPDLRGLEDDVVDRVLEDKAIPARTSARAAYERARSAACATELGEQPLMAGEQPSLPGEQALMPEILDGIQRYGGHAEPCP